VTWAAVSLADKLDTLLGLFAAGEKVSGSRDPFGMRRAGQGVIRILVDLEALTGLTRRPALGALVQRAMQQVNFTWPDQNAEHHFWAFMADRLRHLMQVRGLQYEEIAAVTSHLERIKTRNPRTLVDYASELARVRSTEDFAALAEAFKRANNIVEEAWGGGPAGRRLPADGNLLTEPAEVALRASLVRIGAEVRSHLDAENARAALQSISTIRAELDQFFSQVRVNVDDQALREARLTLLDDLRNLFLEIGDISHIARKRSD
jgi:glycyl-tRNA synthetase beta chain